MKFLGLVELRKGLINPAFIWQLLKGPLHGTNKSHKIGMFADKSLLSHAALLFRNGLEYQNADW